MGSDLDAVHAWLAMLGATNVLKKSLDARMRERFGLSLSRFDVLAALDGAGEDGLTGVSLSGRLKVTEGATTQITAPLIDQGLVRRDIHPSDGRAAIFRLTPRGQRVFSLVAEQNRRWVKEAFAALSPTQLATLRKLLATIKPVDNTAEEEAA
jgi:DNA-binding MarR family transcriptional regulator